MVHATLDPALGQTAASSIVGLADRYQGLLQEMDQATIAAPAAAARK